MPIGRKVKRAGRGDGGVDPRTFNAAAKVLEQLSRIQGGRGVMQTPAGPLMGRDGALYRLGVCAGISARVVPQGQTSPDGTTIAAGLANDASIDLTSADAATIRVQQTSFPAWNLSQQPITTGSLIICTWMFELWIVTWEDCPTPTP